MLTRRLFLAQSAAVAAAGMFPTSAAAGDVSVKRITGGLIFEGRGGGPSWFHPRPTRLPSPSGGAAPVLMTLQLISGSDVFGPVHWTLSEDGGKSWTKPEPVPGLGRETLDPGWERGVCDVVPEYHEQTGNVLAIGHDVFYKDGVLARPQRSRRPVYISRDAAGGWSKPQHLEWDHPGTSGIFSCGCSQRVNLPDGDVLIPLTFGPLDPVQRSVTSVLCRYDGQKLSVRKSGNVLSNPAGRGLLEPSLVRFGDRFFMTIRAEDDRGYVTSSDDGLAWDEQHPWRWDDGTPLSMSTTQQHWIAHSGGLFLVYTRKTPKNAKVIRYRAPLFMAKVDPASLRLIRDSEQVVLPLEGDAQEKPRHVALMGNFHTLNVTPEESWVTVGEHRPYDGYQGDTLLARIWWTSPNGRVA